MATDKPTLYNAWFCPFAQRAWIAMLQAGVDFTYIEQDPYNKTPEWLAISPTGLVPAITHRGQSVYESSICIEYVNDVWGKDHPLLPEDPLDRAYVRIWSDRIGKKFVGLFFGYLLATEAEAQEAKKENLLGELVCLTSAMKDDGPFFMGKEFGMFDAMLFPFAMRFEELKRFRGFEVPSAAIFGRFRAWYAAVAETDCCQKTKPDMDKLFIRDKAFIEKAQKK